MKYLTLDWWMNKCGRQELERYWAYNDGIRSRLPPDLLALLDEVSLHDAKLRALDLEVGERKLVISLDGYRYTRESNEACRRAITLTYGGLREVHSTADPKTGLGGPHGYGDIGYDEIEVHPDGSFEHRLLFSSGIELAVRFERFRLDYRDIPRA